MDRVRIEVTGMRDLFNRLDQWDAQAGKILRNKIKNVGKQVTATASYLAPGAPPLSNMGTWTDSRGRDLGYDPAAVSKGFKVREVKFKTRGVSRGFAIQAYQSNPAGAIFEIMGDGSRITTTSGAAMVARVNQRYPQRRPRSLFAAYYQVITPQVTQGIANDIEDAARKVGLK